MPILWPALLAVCASCAGIPTAAAVGALGALPPRWWLAGFGVTALAVTATEHRHARRCERRPVIARTLASLVLTAVLAWLATRYLAVPAIDALTGPDRPPPLEGPRERAHG